MRTFSLPAVLPLALVVAVSTAACSGGNAGSMLAPSANSVVGATSATSGQGVAGLTTEVEFTGPITAIAGNAVTVGPLGAVVIVPGTATITRNGLPAAFSTLAVGAVVEVRALQVNGVITASSLTIESLPGAVGASGATGSTGTVEDNPKADDDSADDDADDVGDDKGGASGADSSHDATDDRGGASGSSGSTSGSSSNSGKGSSNSGKGGSGKG